MSSRRFYTLGQKIDAVLYFQDQDRVDQDGEVTGQSITHVASELGLPASSLRDWTRQFADTVESLARGEARRPSLDTLRKRLEAS